MRINGVVTGAGYGDRNTCQPYFLRECSHHGQGSYQPCTGTSPTPQCSKQCISSYSKAYKDDLNLAISAYGLDSDEAAIQTEIMTHGSVVASFTVYEDFLTYKSGVYQRSKGKQLGGHAVKVIGWGQESGVN
jgi:cathepsin B